MQRQSPMLALTFHPQRRNITSISLSRAFGVELRYINDIFRLLEGVCAEFGLEIWDEILEMKKASTALTPKKVPFPLQAERIATTPRRKRHVPTPVVNRSRLSERFDTPEETPASADPAKPTRRKRNVATLDFDAPEVSPSRPRKRSRTAESAQGSDSDGMAAFHDAMTMPSGPSSSKITLDRIDEGPMTDDDDDDDDDQLDAVEEVAQSEDHSRSEAEVEGYIDTTTPLNDDDLSDKDDLSPSKETPRRSVRSSHTRRTPTPRRPATPAHVMSHKSTASVRQTATRLVKTATPKWRRPATPVVQLPSSGSDADEEDAVVEPVLPRRLRPVLLSYRQWAERDDGVMRDLQVGISWRDDMMERYGYPHALELLRKLVVGEEDE